MEFVFGLILMTSINQTEIKTETPIERVERSFPGVDLEDSCLILIPNPNSKKRINEKKTKG